MGLLQYTISAAPTRYAVLFTCVTADLDGDQMGEGGVAPLVVLRAPSSTAEMVDLRNSIPSLPLLSHRSIPSLSLLPPDLSPLIITIHDLVWVPHNPIHPSSSDKSHSAAAVSPVRSSQGHRTR